MANVVGSIMKMFEGFSAGTSIGKIGIAFGSFLTAFYSPIMALLVCCFAFTVVDLFYGLKVAIKNKKKIESHKSWKGTLTKILDEWVLISLARLLEWSIVDEQGVFVLTGGITVIIGLTELWSILENLNTLDPHGPWKALGRFLKKKGEDYIGTEIELSDEHTDNNKLDSKESEDAI